MNQQTAASFILSGAAAIAVGREQTPSEAIPRRQSQRIHELAHGLSIRMVAWFAEVEKMA